MEIKKINPEQLKDNVFDLIDNRWFLLSAGTTSDFNTMTASWGGMGILWHKQVIFAFVRPQRYTYEFMEKNNIFTLSFFDDKYKEALQFCGHNSGRTHDKMKETGLVPIASPHNSVFYTQASLMMECKKIYYSDIDPAHFLLSETDAKIYPNKDYHRMYIGEILTCFEI